MSYKFNPFTGNFDEVGTGGGGTGTFSQARLLDNTGTGSTGTAILTFSTIQIGTGTDLTIVQDAVNGDYIQIETDGLYSVVLLARMNAQDLGVSINASLAEQASPLSAISASHILLFGSCVHQQHTCTSDVRMLSAGDKLRAHVNNGAGLTAGVFSYFCVTRIRDIG